MAEEILVKEQLTKEMIIIGEDVLQALRKDKFEILALFWLYSSESNEWTLTIVSPQVDSDGPLKTYARVGNAITKGAKTINASTLNLTVLSPNEDLVRALASVNAFSPLSRIRLSRSGLNGIYVEDIYIYFIASSVQPLPGPRYVSK